MIAALLKEVVFMKIRTRLTVAILVGVIPVLIGMVIILAVSSSSDKNKTIDLIEEYTGGIAESIAAFFEEGASLATYLAGLHADMGLEWLDGGKGSLKALSPSLPM